MSIMLLLFMSCCVQDGLREPFLKAVMAWEPATVPYLSFVRWCAGDEECNKVHDEMGGAQYDYLTKEIVVSRRAIVSEDWDDYVLTIVLEHEIGHAMGLPHNKKMDSIMRPGWEQPWVTEPSEEDIERALKLQR